MKEQHTPNRQIEMSQAFVEIDCLSGIQIQNLLGLYNQAWWTKTRTLEETRIVIENSDLLIGLIDPRSKELVAFARVLTDFIFKAFVYDVIVSESLRGRGLGKRIMVSLLSHPKLSVVEHIELYCQPEMVAFYQKLGFSLDTQGNTLMRLAR